MANNTCGTECLDYRQQGDEKLCVCCVWDRAYNAGLEAAALEADRVAAVHETWAKTTFGIVGAHHAARSVATVLRILAHDLRAMKGNDQ